MIGDADALWRLGMSGTGVTIGHLDTAIDPGHEVFEPAGRVTAGIIGYRGLGCAAPQDTIVPAAWHGTHTAALMAGGRSADGSFGGLAPDASLVTFAVIEEGDVVARVLAGLDRLLDADVDVVNLSIGLPGNTPVFRSAIRALIDRDVVVIVPVGNGAAGKSTAPGRYAVCLSVGAVDARGNVAAFSGSAHAADAVTCTKPDVVAPGIDIVSAVPGGEYAAKTGTSMASAAVAGIAALLRSGHRDASAADTVDAIVTTASARRRGQEHRSRRGTINPLAAHHYLSKRGVGNDVDSSTPVARRVDPPDEVWIDPRLRSRLAASVHGDQVDAVLEFANRAAAEAAIHWTDDAEPPAEIRLLSNLPTLIGRAHSRVVSGLLEWSTLRIASACDVDRLGLTNS